MKAKKVLAVLMASAMIMGTSVTAFAAPDQESLTSTITVSGLTQNETATLKVYAAVTLDENRNEWIVADWAKSYIVLNDDATKYEITDPAALGVAAEKASPTYTKEDVTATTVDFDNVPVGAYVILASGSNEDAGTETVYSTMVANSYDNTGTYIQVKDVPVVAKSSKVTLTKKEIEGDKFVGRGETVEFTITTTFPNFEDADNAGNTYEIYDTPTGLDITNVKSITIGGSPLTAGQYTTSEDSESGKYTINLDDVIGTTNENAGKTVVVTYEAIVTTDEGYSNTANSSNADSDTVEGWTGDLTLTKVAFEKDNDDKLDDNATLAGAKFKVHVNDKSGSVLKFIKKADGNYMLAKEGEDGAVEEIEVDETGVVKVTGLGGGTYFFEETLAPDGYSINEDGVAFTIDEEDATGDISLSDYMVDTKLASLPSTGGIGTTIFTIGGCVIMVTAAGLYFATRKKTEK